MYTTDNDHGAEFQMHTGRHTLDEQQPTIGSWVSYGLGTLNENLPQFVFLGQYKDVRVKKDFAPDYLGPQHAGVELSLDPANPLPFGTRGKGVSEKEQQGVFDFANELNGLAAAEYPDDEQTKARIKSYELAFRMQKAVAGGARPREGAGEIADALRHRQPGHRGLRPAPARGPPAGGEGRALHAGVPQRLRRVGLAQRPQEPARPQRAREWTSRSRG